MRASADVSVRRAVRASTDTRVFADTNVLVYARDRADPTKHERARAWIATLWERRAGRLSFQVLQEYYVTVTRKLDPPRDPDDAREDVALLASWRPLGVDLRSLDRAWEIQDRLGFSWWDALIVATALDGGCAVLLTEDFQDGQEIDGLRIVDPFAHTPESILGG